MKSTSGTVASMAHESPSIQELPDVEMILGSYTNFMGECWRGAIL